MEGATIIVAIEATWRLSCCNPFSTQTNVHSFWPSFLFIGAYLLCILTIFLELKKYDCAKWTLLRNTLTFLHACDGIIALLLGLALYYESMGMVAIALIAITKLFLVHLLSRMVTGVVAYGSVDISKQTTKTFIHHVGSFFFIANHNVALITAFWRFISMSGHAAMTLRSRLSVDAYRRVTWIIASARNIALLSVLIVTILYADIRRGFALSATGHVAYMLVRLGPIFRLGGGGGSIYMSEKERDAWTLLTDSQRMKALLLGQHLWLSLELSILLLACVYFCCLRLTTFGTIVHDTCSVI